MPGGEFRYSLDDKGRISMPSKLRSEIGEAVTLTKGVGDPCIFVFASSEWEEVLLRSRDLKMTDPNARRFERFLIGGSAECVLDKSGRISIPQNLREYAHLSKEVVIVWLTKRIEIWDSALWDSYNDVDDDYITGIAAEISIL